MGITMGIIWYNAAFSCKVKLDGIVYFQILVNNHPIRKQRRHQMTTSLETCLQHALTIQKMR